MDSRYDSSGGWESCEPDRFRIKGKFEKHMLFYFQESLKIFMFVLGHIIWKWVNIWHHKILLSVNLKGKCPPYTLCMQNHVFKLEIKGYNVSLTIYDEMEEVRKKYIVLN